MPGRIELVNEHGRVHEIQREGCRHAFSLSKTERRRIVKGRKIRKKVISEWPRVRAAFPRLAEPQPKLFQTSCRRKQKAWSLKVKIEKSSKGYRGISQIYRKCS